jgi:hypothetical protein
LATSPFLHRPRRLRRAALGGLAHAPAALRFLPAQHFLLTSSQLTRSVIVRNTTEPDEPASATAGGRHSGTETADGSGPAGRLARSLITGVRQRFRRGQGCACTVRSQASSYDGMHTLNSRRPAGPRREEPSPPPPSAPPRRGGWSTDFSPTGRRARGLGAPAPQTLAWPQRRQILRQRLGVTGDPGPDRPPPWHPRRLPHVAVEVALRMENCC